MFDIGMIEMFMIVVLAIIVVGPKDLPRMLRTIGRFIAKIRKMGQEFQSSVKQMADEVELEEVTRRLNQAGNIPREEGDVTPNIIPEEAEETDPPVRKKPPSGEAPSASDREQGRA